MELESARIFVKVVQQSSFSKAAHLLKLPVSTVSRSISRLEAEVGTRLLHRTTRNLRLTPEGRLYFERCAGPIQVLEDARKALQGRDSVVSGQIKITTTEDIGAYGVTPIIASLMKEHPALTFEFNYTDEVVDLVKDGYDLAIRVGRLNPSRFRAIQVGEIAGILVASPEYLASRPRLQSPRDLQSQDFLTFVSDSATPRLTLHHGSGTLSKKKESVTLLIQPRSVGNQMGSLVRLAQLGAGVALVPRFACKKELDEGTLIHVLPNWAAKGLPVSLVSTHTTQMSARVRLVADRLAGSMRKLLAH